MFCLPCRRSRVRIPSAALEKACICRTFSCSSRVVRLRHRTMTGQSCPRRLADAVGRCSLAGDSERPAPWNFCVAAEDRDRPRRVGAPAPPAPLRLVRGRSAAFVEEQEIGAAPSKVSASGGLAELPSPPREEDVGFVLLVVGAVGESDFGESVSRVERPCAVVALEDPQPEPARTAILCDLEQG
jgi:hypothetical protein